MPFFTLSNQFYNFINPSDADESRSMSYNIIKFRGGADPDNVILVQEKKDNILNWIWISISWTLSPHFVNVALYQT